MRRIAAKLSQRLLGERAGIGGRYVSEIERGNRDLPLSTLRAIVERGLRLDLEIAFRDRGAAPRPLPAHIAQIATSLADLPAEPRAVVVDIVRQVVELAASLVGSGSERQ